MFSAHSCFREEKQRRQTGWYKQGGEGEHAWARTRRQRRRKRRREEEEKRPDQDHHCSQRHDQCCHLNTEACQGEAKREKEKNNWDNASPNSTGHTEPRAERRIYCCYAALWKMQRELEDCWNKRMLFEAFWTYLVKTCVFVFLGGFQLKSQLDSKSHTANCGWIWFASWTDGQVLLFKCNILAGRFMLL